MEEISKSKVFFLLCLLYLIGTAFWSSRGYTPPEFPYDTKVSFKGYIVAEPDVRIDSVRYIILSEKFGRVQIKHNLYPRFSYGDTLKINCKLRKPEPIENFRYDMYLARFNIFATCSHPYVSLLENTQGNVLMRSILKLKEIVAERINTLWPEPHASFMAGLLYGYRGGLGSLNEHFSRTGVTHIVAISGYNITIISMILMKAFSYMLIPRKKAFWLIVFGIICFLIFAGLSASVVRAGIMGIIVLVARQLGRPSRVANVLLLTAVIMTIHSPHILLWDAGFQLSYISTIGLVYITPKIEKYFMRIPEAFALRESVMSTFSAIIATLPLILFQFKRFSIVAPIVNVLILWIIPWIMSIGFFAVVLSYIFYPFAILLVWISYFGMEYIIRVVKLFSALPFAAIDMSFSVWFMVVGYIALGFFIKQK